MAPKEITGLSFPGDWKFEGIGFEIPLAAVNEFIDLVGKIADGSKDTIEGFKHAFGLNSISTSLDWAVSDMERAMKNQSQNAALFVDSLWRGIQLAELKGHPVPSLNSINRILQKHDIPLQVSPPNLFRLDNDSVVSEADEGDDPMSEGNGKISYKLGKEIGRGGYGVVHRATRVTSAGTFEFALKILDPSTFISDFDKALKRFKKEVAVLSSLQHRSIIHYFEAGVFGGHKPFIVMPFVDGIHLREACSGGGLGVIVPIFKEILTGIEYAHSKEVLHRDLKPSNILVRNSDRQPIILDFGSAYILDQMDTHTLTTQSVGTIGYIPSEILNNPKKRSKLHDVYSCGMMLYEVIAGQRPDPFDYKLLSEIDISYQGVDKIVKKAIAGESNRLASASEFLKALESL